MFRKHVKTKGKQWAILVKKLNDRRSEHSIKNKYNAIMRKQERLTPMMNENELIEAVLERAKRLLCSQEIEINDEFIFGSSVKSLNEEGNKKKRCINHSTDHINFNNKL